MAIESYHVNPKTGVVNECRAQIQCRWADSKHYATRKDAQLAFEEVNKNDLLKTLSRKDSDRVKSSFDNSVKISEDFVNEIVSKIGFPIRTTNINTKNKFNKFSKEVSNDRFVLTFFGSESLVFKDKSSGLLLKVYRDLNKPYNNYLYFFGENKKFYDDYKDKDICINNSVYKIPETVFAIVDNVPVMIQEDLSDFDKGCIPYEDSSELLDLGFYDLKDENTKVDNDGVIYLFDCFPE